MLFLYRTLFQRSFFQCRLKEINGLQSRDLYVDQPKALLSRSVNQSSWLVIGHNTKNISIKSWPPQIDCLFYFLFFFEGEGQGDLCRPCQGRLDFEFRKSPKTETESKKENVGCIYRARFECKWSKPEALITHTNVIAAKWSYMTQLQRSDTTQTILISMNSEFIQPRKG